MISLERITPRNAMVLKEIRLRALQDAPSAFSSTYAQESQLSDSDWIERARQWSGEHSIAYLAVDEAIPCGIVAAFLDPQDDTRAQLVSMWVEPSRRRRGIASLLVEAIMDWARGQSARTVRLIVTSNNDGAIRFYEHLGFTMIGCIASHANDPSPGDCEMIRVIE
jgi:ribosomal protein S18 acetylase RimI-like enzyme